MTSATTRNALDIAGVDVVGDASTQRQCYAITYLDIRERHVSGRDTTHRGVVKDV